MQASKLDIYCTSHQKHEGIPLYEWLLEFAKKHQIPGGTAFRAIAGFGHHETLHEEHFFELGSDVPLMVSFILEEKKCDTFLNLLKQEKLELFITKTETIICTEF